MSDPGTVGMWNRIEPPSTTYPDSFYDEISKSADRLFRDVIAHREKYLKAWVAETGIMPSEAVLIERKVVDPECLDGLRSELTVRADNETWRAGTIFAYIKGRTDGVYVPVWHEVEVGTCCFASLPAGQKVRVLAQDNNMVRVATVGPNYPQPSPNHFPTVGWVYEGDLMFERPRCARLV